MCNDARKKQKIEEVDMRDKASHPDGDPYYDSNSPDDTSTSKLLDLSDSISISIGIPVDGDAKCTSVITACHLELRRLWLSSGRVLTTHLFHCGWRHLSLMLPASVRRRRKKTSTRRRSRITCVVVEKNIYKSTNI